MSAEAADREAATSSRPCTPPQTCWFEFLLEESLLEKHLRKPCPGKRGACSPRGAGRSLPALPGPRAFSDLKVRPRSGRRQTSSRRAPSLKLQCRSAGHRRGGPKKIAKQALRPPLSGPFLFGVLAPARWSSAIAWIGEPGSNTPLYRTPAVISLGNWGEINCSGANSDAD